MDPGFMDALAGVIFKRLLITMIVAAMAGAFIMYGVLHMPACRIRIEKVQP